MSSYRGILLPVLVLLLALAVATAFAAEGDRDPSFGSDGRVVSPIGAGVVDLAVDSRGRIVVVAKPSSGTGLLLARFGSDGSLDGSFSGDGWILLDQGAGLDIDSMGRIVVGGTVSGEGGSYFSAARYLEDGTPDPAFGGDGLAVLNTAPVESARTVAADAQGRVVIAGVAGKEIAVGRFTAGGEPDHSFGPDALRRIAAPGYKGVFASAVQVDAAGRVVVAGTAYPGFFTGDFAIARLQEDGSPDLAFGSQGLATLKVSDREGASLQDVAIDRTGRLVAVGGAAAARLLPDGSPDAEFGGDGTRVYPLGSGSFLYRVAIDSAGRIVVAGSVMPGRFPEQSDRAAAVARLTADGGLDQTFGAGGLVSENFAPGEDIGMGLAVDPRGRYVLGAEVRFDGGRIGLARYLTDQREPSPPTQPPTAPVRCRGKQATKTGTPGADRLSGTRGRDVIVAFGGNDRIIGFRGNDLICAGKGKDLVRAGGGRDRVLGGPGPDRLFGGPGGDLLLGQRGGDLLVGGPGRDRLRGGPGRDVRR